jgi:hypothetical protein
MVRRKIGTTLAACGIIMLMFGLSALPALGAEPVRMALQPSPRPAIDPIRRGGEGSTMGHITGTVIDLTTGAPAAGIAVDVGGEIVTSDANGNYDHWLPVGTYPVALALADSQGTPEQGTVSVTVPPDAPAIQHLSFRSPPLPTVAPAPIVAADPVVAQPAAPALKQAPQSVVPQAAHSAPPTQLPRTAAPDYGGWLWLAFGMALLLAGGLVGFAPAVSGRSAIVVLRAQAANSTLLRKLLSTPARPGERRVRPTEPAREELLAKLLDAERAGRRR